MTVQLNTTAESTQLLLRSVECLHRIFQSEPLKWHEPGRRDGVQRASLLGGRCQGASLRQQRVQTGSHKDLFLCRKKHEKRRQPPKDSEQAHVESRTPKEEEGGVRGGGVFCANLIRLAQPNRVTLEAGRSSPGLEKQEQSHNKKSERGSSIHPFCCRRAFPA